MVSFYCAMKGNVFQQSVPDTCSDLLNQVATFMSCDWMSSTDYYIPASFHKGNYFKIIYL